MSNHSHSTDHDHSPECHCGEHHSCGQHEDHEHSCCEGGCCGGHSHQPIELSQQDCDFLSTLAQIPFLPLARFLMTSIKSDHLESVALAPVYLTDGTETVAQVRETGDMLLNLEGFGLISLDYDQPLQGFDYGLYQNSAAFHTLEDVVREGSQKEGFLFDRALVETGSVALTALGQQVIDQLGRQ